MGGGHFLFTKENSLFPHFALDVSDIPRAHLETAIFINANSENFFYDFQCRGKSEEIRNRHVYNIYKLL